MSKKYTLAIPRHYDFDLYKDGRVWHTSRVKITDPEEAEVLEFLIGADLLAENQKHNIIAALAEFGSHDTYETPRKRTSMRKLQQILRNLTEAGAPIVRDPKRGVWIATNVQELLDYADWLENKAKADIASMMHMRNKILETADIKKASLFDNF